MGLGSRLKEILERYNMSPKELADRIGVPPTTIYSMIQRDSKKADIDTLIAIAKELNTTTDYLLYVDGIEEPLIIEEVKKDMDKLNNEELIRVIEYASYLMKGKKDE